MMKFDNISQELLIARGMYATVRSEHENAKKDIQMLCGGLSAASAQILRAVQPDNDAPHDAEQVAFLLTSCRTALDDIEKGVAKIRDLAEQRAAIKPRAWPRGN